MKIAVVGASGVAGRVFVPLAVAAGHTVLGQRVDVFDPAALRSAFGGCDAVVNLATSIPRAGGRGDWTVNDRIRRDGTANLLMAAAETNVGIVIQQSVAMLHCVADDRPQTEDDPIEGYGVLASAADLEALVRVSPLDVRVVRGGQFYGGDSGARERWINEVSTPGFCIPGDGTAWISPIHVADFAAALMSVLTRGEPRGVYLVCEDEAVQLREFYAEVARRAGVKTPATGGPQRLRSFRTSNARLRALGWRPTQSWRDPWWAAQGSNL